MSPRPWLALCAICRCDAAIRRDPKSGLRVCRRPACEFEALHAYGVDRLTMITADPA